MLSTKNLIFKEQPAGKLVDQYVGLYIIVKIVSTNAIKLQFPTSMRIYPVVNVLQNKLLTCLWYLNLGYTLRGLGMIQKFNNDDNNDKDQYRCWW